MNIIVIISLILIAVFIGVSAVLFSRASRIRRSAVRKVEEGMTETPETSFERWQGVLKHLESLNESEWRVAVIEADKLIDEILTQKGFMGESVAEKLSEIDRGQMKSIDRFWEAHKTRNRIVHKFDYKIEQSEARKMISYYEEALVELGAM